MMSFKIIHTASGIGVLAAALLMPVVGIAAEEADTDVASLIANGKASYLASCASCHGADGTGDGSVAEYLTVKPSDLTQIGKDQNGEFPFDAIYDVVDGRAVAGHGSREMPVWGPAFKGMGESASKQTVKEKIVELVYYLKSIQGSAG
jgi:mono/diheme cytochrome c family protein